MDQKIKNISSKKDTHIGILYHIKNNLAIDLEIENILSGQDIDVRIKGYFQNSPDYQKLLKRIAEQRRKLEQLEEDGNKNKFAFEKKKLQELEQAQKSFKVGALRLAETFLSITTKSERLESAQAHFEQGLISEADKLLLETDLINDQEGLIAKMEYLQNRKALLLGAILNANNL